MPPRAVTESIAEIKRGFRTVLNQNDDITRRVAPENPSPWGLILHPKTLQAIEFAPICINYP